MANHSSEDQNPGARDDETHWENAKGGSGNGEWSGKTLCRSLNLCSGIIEKKCGLAE
jgi:hypothetical protein